MKPWYPPRFVELATPTEGKHRGHRIYVATQHIIAFGERPQGGSWLRYFGEPTSIYLDESPETILAVLRGQPPARGESET